MLTSVLMRLQLQHKHAFGVKADVANNIHYISDNQLLYPVGHTICLYNVDTRTQKVC